MSFRPIVLCIIAFGRRKCNVECAHLSLLLTVMSKIMVIFVTLSRNINKRKVPCSRVVIFCENMQISAAHSAHWQSPSERRVMWMAINVFGMWENFWAIYQLRFRITDWIAFYWWIIYRQFGKQNYKQWRAISCFSADSRDIQIEIRVYTSRAQCRTYWHRICLFCICYSQFSGG